MLTNAIPDISTPIFIDEKEGIVSLIHTTITGITLVYVDFDKPVSHWKIYLLES